MIRAIDFLLALIAIIFLLPIFIIIVPILRFTGEGEVFYFQERYGLSGKKFNILKFATMKKDSPNLDGGMLTVENDPRILPIGHFLRASKINELPQIINILIGDMSIIGPMSLTEEIISYYDIGIKAKNIVYQARPFWNWLNSFK